MRSFFASEVNICSRGDGYAGRLASFRTCPPMGGAHLREPGSKTRNGLWRPFLGDGHLRSTTHFGALTVNRRYGRQPGAFPSEATAVYSCG
jgi:hypothetical protein